MIGINATAERFEETLEILKLHLKVLVYSNMTNTPEWHNICGLINNILKPEERDIFYAEIKNIINSRKD